MDCDISDSSEYILDSIDSCLWDTIEVVKKCATPRYKNENNIYEDDCDNIREKKGM